MKRESDYSYHDSVKAPRYEGGGRGRGRGRSDSWSSGPYYPDSRDDYSREYRGRGRGGVRGRGRGRLAGKPPVFPLPEEAILVQDIPVKKEFAGAVIGVGGERVKKLREDTGCKVHIKKTTPESLQIIELTGRLHEIETAMGALQKIINDVDPNHLLERPSKYICYIDIYPDMVGCVIGRHGDRVKQVKQESGAHVRVEEQQPDSEFQVVSITGELHQVQSAYKMVAGNLDQFDPTRVKHRPMRPYTQYGEPYGPGPGHNHDGYGPPPSGAEFNQYSYNNPAPIVAAGDYGPSGGAVFNQPPMAQNTGAASTIVVNPGSGAGAGQAATPQVLVLQPDGTYKPVQAVVYSLPQGANAGQPSAQQQQQAPIVINQAPMEAQPQAQTQAQAQQANTGVSPVSLAGLTAALPAGARIITLSSLQDPATSSALTQLISPNAGVQQGLVGQIFNPQGYGPGIQSGQQPTAQIVTQSGYQ